MKPAVSIIVPVYNGEKTLERCVDSVLKQEYEDFELFLVNDGSTDKTREICDRYAASDERVLVIHKENSGVSESRNMAIARHTGNICNFSTATTGSRRMRPNFWCGRRGKNRQIL